MFAAAVLLGMLPGPPAPAWIGFDVSGDGAMIEPLGGLVLAAAPAGCCLTGPRGFRLGPIRIPPRRSMRAVAVCPPCAVAEFGADGKVLRTWRVRDMQPFTIDGRTMMLFQAAGRECSRLLVAPE